MREWWNKHSLEEKRQKIAGRDPERVRAADRARYYRNWEKRRAAAAAYQRANSDVVRAAHERWAQRNPEKRKAHYAVSNAIRDGRMKRPETCEVDGCDRRPQAHHDDYSKPFDVRWLCSRHHGEVHRRYAA
jgi:hypothetical protein